MLELVQEIVFKVTGKRNINPETDFIKDLDLNSFDIMNIVCAFEDHFNMSVPTRDVWRMHQVKDVIAYIEQKVISKN